MKLIDIAQANSIAGRLKAAIATRQKVREASEGGLLQMYVYAALAGEETFSVPASFVLDALDKKIARLGNVLAELGVIDLP
jgi:hypothetical protein